MDDLRSQLIGWWRPLVAVAVGLALFGAAALAAARQDDAVVARLQATAARAETGVGAVLTRELTADEVVDPLDAADFRDLYVVVRAEVLTDPTVLRVRIWGEDGTILFSSGDRAEIGTAPEGNPPIVEVMAGATVTRDVTERFTASTAGLQPSPVRMWQTWLPLVTGDRTQPQGVVEVDHDRATVLAGAGESAARLATTLQVLAIVSLILAAALAVMTGLTHGPVEHDDSAHEDIGVDPGPDTEAAVAMAEVAAERDVSMARASEAEERARLADDRLASLGPLEQRVEVAERRALDAERRLDEIDDRVGAATIDEVSDGPSEPTVAARQAAELRARLARTAARKKPTGGDR